MSSIFSSIVILPRSELTRFSTSILDGVVCATENCARKKIAIPSATFRVLIVVSSGPSKEDDIGFQREFQPQFSSLQKNDRSQNSMSAAEMPIYAELDVLCLPHSQQIARLEILAAAEDHLD